MRSISIYSFLQLVLRVFLYLGFISGCSSIHFLSLQPSLLLLPLLSVYSLAMNGFSLLSVLMQLLRLVVGYLQMVSQMIL